MFFILELGPGNAAGAAEDHQEMQDTLLMLALLVRSMFYHCLDN